jgi:hypothetical protein
VARERRLDGDLGGLEVADLTDHDDVGVLPQEGAQRGREVQADVVVHLHLVDAIRLYSTGSSAVLMLVSTWFSSESAE